jgi:hypothetical protein
VAEAVAVMSTHRRNDFPPHWVPPPKRLSGHDRRDVIAVVEALEHIADNDTPAWVREVYLDRAKELLKLEEDGMAPVVDENRTRLAAALGKVPGGDRVLQGARWLKKEKKP